MRRVVLDGRWDNTEAEFLMAKHAGVGTVRLFPAFVASVKITADSNGSHLDTCSDNHVSYHFRFLASSKRVNTTH